MVEQSVDFGDRSLMTDPLNIKGSTILFVTGRLAEASLRSVVSDLSGRLGFRYEIAVPGIQVAALLHADLLRRRLTVADDIDRVILPGWCQGELAELETQFGKPFERGPKNLHDLPEHFGLGKRRNVSLDEYNIEIVAEINHAPRLPIDTIVREATKMAKDGANLIDVGCVPGESSNRVGEIVAALRSQNLRVSIDSFDRSEVEQAVAAGAELILSCNHSNIDWVTQLDAEVVAIPDTPADLESLDRIVERLVQEGVPFRLDPIIEPIGMGFTASLERYITVRARYPETPMMMGTGNITELTEVDSAGVNMVLAAICEELKIHSVLTTQVINWCRSSVAEFDAARRLTHHSVSSGVIPKHLDSSLVMLRDPRVREESAETLAGLADALTDGNFRVFAESSGLHLMNRDGHWRGEDAFRVFAEAMRDRQTEIDAGHAFYLGYEMARAELAQHLGKEYVQDEPMKWGLLGDWKASSAVHDYRPQAESEDD
jgi:dihydropteroate synthase